MATAREVVKWALRKATITSPGEDPASDEMADALESLNDMLAAWALDGLALGATLPLAEASEVNVEDAYLRCVKYGLAVEVADDYGVTLPLKVYNTADAEQRMVRAALFVDEDLTFELPLTAIPNEDGWAA